MTRRRLPRSRAVIAGLVVAVLLAAGAASGVGQPAAVRFASYPAPAPFAADSGEPSLGVDWKSGAIFLQGKLETDKITFAGNTPTWSDVSSSTTQQASLDAIAVSDNSTGRLLVSQLIGVGSLMALSDDDGATWTTSQGSGLPAGYDHQSVGVGPYPSGRSGSYRDAVYYCSQVAVAALCARSDDGGKTFGVSVPVFNFLDCVPSHGHLRIAPDGTVYLPNKNCLQGQGFAVSTDAGSTWTVHKVPGSQPGTTSDPSVALGSDGTGYFSYADGTGHLMVAVTRDRGTSWAEPRDLGAQVGVRSAEFPEAIAGDGDRAAVAFLGTKTTGNSQDEFFGMDASHTQYVGAEYHLYVATTYDRGRTWNTVDVTPNDPVQRGRICLGGASCGGTADTDHNLLDFMDINVDRSGRVLVGWSDGCTGTCIRSTAVADNKHGAHGTLSRQSSGAGLFGKPPALR